MSETHRNRHLHLTSLWNWTAWKPLWETSAVDHVSSSTCHRFCFRFTEDPKLVGECKSNRLVSWCSRPAALFGYIEASGSQMPLLFALITKYLHMAFDCSLTILTPLSTLPFILLFPYAHLTWPTLLICEGTFVIWAEWVISKCGRNKRQKKCACASHGGRPAEWLCPALPCPSLPGFYKVESNKYVQNTIIIYFLSHNWQTVLNVEPT